MTQPSAPPPSAPPTRTERLVLWARGHRLVAALLVVGVVVVALGTFTGSLKKTAGAVAGLLRGPSKETLATQAQVRQAARLFDAFLTRAIAEPVLEHRHPTRDEYQQMHSALQGLAITFNAQNQPQMAKTVEQGLALLRRWWTPGAVVPSEWQVERLQQQRAEWDAIFRALGQPLSSVGPASEPVAP